MHILLQENIYVCSYILHSSLGYNDRTRQHSRSMRLTSLYEDQNLIVILRQDSEKLLQHFSIISLIFSYNV